MYDYWLRIYHTSIEMDEKLQKRKTSLLGKPFDLNRNRKVDPAEAALIMMVIDDVNKEKETHTNIVKDNIINIDDMDIEGI